MDGAFAQIPKNGGDPMVSTKGMRGHDHDTAKWQAMNSVTDVVQAGMKAMILFRDIRRVVYLWAKAQGHFVTGTERVHDVQIQNIRVTFRHSGGDIREVIVRETSAYTKRYQLPTW
jgi:hypothetical protein